MASQIKLFLSLLFFLSVSGYSQVIFTSIPKHMQLIPRDKNNLGVFVVTGTCLDTSIKSLQFIVRLNKDSSVISDNTLTLQGIPDFSIQLSIPAALQDYNLKIYSRDFRNLPNIEREVRQLVAGDYFIVTGQSNAAGAVSDIEAGLIEDSLYGNRYCRTIGSLFQRVSLDSNVSNEEDLSYHYASSLFWVEGSKGCIGIWPLRILNNVVKQTGIPLCILNGAVGATELSYHLASATPSDPQKLHDTLQSQTFSVYDRLYRRLYSNSATNGVKAIFWYQGESDAVLGKDMAQTYNKRFARLRESWKLDYPNLEKIFVFQINTGCAGDNMSLIRDQQRKLTLDYPDVIVMPTVGSASDERALDGCHYTQKGYAKIGENMSLAVLKYLYHFDVEDKYILGPDIRRIYYSKKDELCLEFNMEVSVQQSQHFYFQNEGTAYLKDYFYNKNGKAIGIESITSQDKKVFLRLNDTSKITTLTYLPNIFSNIPTVYMGPWILNKNNENLGALTFFEFPVEEYPDEFLFNGTDSLLVYPNPTTDYFEIRIRKAITLNNLRLYDVSGKMVLNIPTQWREKIHVDLPEFENGIYFLKADTNSGFIVKKIVIVK